MTYIAVAATILRELASRESGCIFALVFAGGNVLAMPFRLLRIPQRREPDPESARSALSACL